MLIDNGDGTCFCGPSDIVYILRLPNDRYHVVFTEEHPMPGPIRDIETLEVLRMKSKMHHTTGADDFAGAQQHLQEMLTKLKIQPENVVSEVAFDSDDPVRSFMLANWTRGGVSLRDALADAFPAIGEGAQRAEG